MVATAPCFSSLGPGGKEKGWKRKRKAAIEGKQKGGMIAGQGGTEEIWRQAEEDDINSVVCDKDTQDERSEWHEAKWRFVAGSEIKNKTLGEIRRISSR